MLVPNLDRSALMLARIRALQCARPFVPFVITATDGCSYEIPTPDHVTVTRLLQEIVLESDDCWIRNLSPLHVAEVECRPPTAA